MNKIILIFSYFVLIGCSSSSKVRTDAESIPQNVVATNPQVHSSSCDGSPHGSLVNGYLQPISPKGTPCTPAIKTCLNGIWVGPEVFPNCLAQ